jgi:hypothetical protein
VSAKVQRYVVTLALRDATSKGALGGPASRLHCKTYFDPVER